MRYLYNFERFNENLKEKDEKESKDMQGVEQGPNPEEKSNGNKLVKLETPNKKEPRDDK